MTDPRRRILVVGDVIDDIVVEPRGAIRPDTDTDAAISMRPGGSAANTAAWLGALGAEVELVARVGRDDLPRHERSLRETGVTPRLQADPSAQTGAIVILVEGQHRTMLTERGANLDLDLDQIDREVLESTAILHLTGHIAFDPHARDAVARLIERARAAGAIVSVDPGSAGFIADMGVEAFWEAFGGVDILLPNLEEGRVLSAETDVVAVVRRLVTRVGVVALTLGEDGVLVAGRGTAVQRVPSLSARLVDPTGAGDAFAAGFLNGWLEHADAIAAAEHGVALAVRAVETVGGRP